MKDTIINADKRRIIRVFSVILFSCLVIGLASMNVYADEEYIDGDGTVWSYAIQPSSAIYPGAVCIRGCTNIPEDGVLKIPSSINGIDVELINIYAFDHNTSINEVILPEGIKWLGGGAFMYCSNLRKINFPDSLEQIGGNCFQSCGFTELVLPENMTAKIGDQAFGANQDLKKVTISNNLELDASIAKVFWYCTDLEEYIVTGNADHYRVVDGVLYSSDMKEILAYPMAHREAEYTIPAGVEIIGDYCFDQCRLTNIELPQGLKTIGNHSFQTCMFLRSIDIPNSVQTLGDSCFDLCSNFEEITLHEGLEIIGASSFRGCQRLQELELPDSVKYIGHDAFNVMTSLKTIYIGQNVSEIGEKAFDNIDNLVIYTPGNKVVVDYAGANSLAYLIATKEEYERGIGKEPINPVDQELVGPNEYIQYIGKSFPLEVESQSTLDFTSSDDSIATVDGNGIVSIKGYGTCVIIVTAAATDLYNETTKYITIKGRLAKPTLSGKSKAKKKVKITWGGTAGADGYQIYVKQPGKSKFKLVGTKSSKIKSMTFGKLKKGKTYYYKVRAYKKVGGQIVCSDYSKGIKIKVKK